MSIATVVKVSIQPTGNFLTAETLSLVLSSFTRYNSSRSRKERTGQEAKEIAMHKYFCEHRFPVGSLTEEKLCQVAEATQHESNIKGYRSFVNLTEGKVWCILEANDREAIVAWFNRMEIPYDSITLLEFEGERGVIEDLRLQPTLV
jgi:hypothetical protein